MCYLQKRADARKNPGLSVTSDRSDILKAKRTKAAPQECPKGTRTAWIPGIGTRLLLFFVEQTIVPFL